MLFQLGKYELLIIIAVLIFVVVGVQGMMGLVLFLRRRSLERRSRRRARKS